MSMFIKSIFKNNNNNLIESNENKNINFYLKTYKQIIIILIIHINIFMSIKIFHFIKQFIIYYRKIILNKNLLKNKSSNCETKLNYWKGKIK